MVFSGLLLIRVISEIRGSLSGSGRGHGTTRRRSGNTRQSGGDRRGLGAKELRESIGGFVDLVVVCVVCGNFLHPFRVQGAVAVVDPGWGFARPWALFFGPRWGQWQDTLKRELRTADPVGVLAVVDQCGGDGDGKAVSSHRSPKGAWRDEGGWRCHNAAVPGRVIQSAEA
jgi:hypothetical protein